MAVTVIFNTDQEHRMVEAWHADKLRNGMIPDFFSWLRSKYQGTDWVVLPWNGEDQFSITFPDDAAAVRFKLTCL